MRQLKFQAEKKQLRYLTLLPKIPSHICLLLFHGKEMHVSNFPYLLDIHSSKDIIININAILSKINKHCHNQRSETQRTNNDDNHLKLNLGNRKMFTISGSKTFPRTALAPAASPQEQRWRARRWWWWRCGGGGDHYDCYRHNQC